MVPKKIIKVRKSFKISQLEVSEKIGVSRPTYRKFERGLTQLKIPQLQKLAKLLKMDFDEILPSKEKKQNKNEDSDYKIQQIILYIIKEAGNHKHFNSIVLSNLMYIIYKKLGSNFNLSFICRPEINSVHSNSIPILICDLISKKSLETIIDAQKFEGQKYILLKNTDLKVINGAELEIIQSVLRTYGDYSAAFLYNKIINGLDVIV